MCKNFVREYIIPLKCAQSFVIWGSTVFFTQSGKNETVFPDRKILSKEAYSGTFGKFLSVNGNPHPKNSVLWRA